MAERTPNDMIRNPKADREIEKMLQEAEQGKSAATALENARRQAQAREKALQDANR